MELRYDVPEEKRIRVIVDTDAACEADDPFAIAHALMTKKFEVKGITAEHFVTEGSVEKSLAEVKTILRLMGKDVQALLGNKGPLSVDGSLSEAGAFIVEEAMKERLRPLFVLCLGAITNVAAALKKYPEIAFAGKSNVGKSSLINGLMNRKNYARTSAQPGKTQTINFYNINEELYFVDLPGYGYANASVEETESDD